MQAFCLKCRAHREINEAQQVTLKNGRPATRGTCAACGSRVSRIGRPPKWWERVRWPLMFSRG